MTQLTVQVDAVSSAPTDETRGETLVEAIETRVPQIVEEGQEPSADSQVLEERSLDLVDLPVNNKAVAEVGGVGEKRKLEDSHVNDESEEEGEIVEDRAEKRAKV